MAYCPECSASVEYGKQNKKGISKVKCKCGWSHSCVTDPSLSDGEDEENGEEQSE